MTFMTFLCVRIEERSKSQAEAAKPAMKHGANRFTMVEDRSDNYKVYAEYRASVIARDHPVSCFVRQKNPHNLGGL